MSGSSILGEKMKKCEVFVFAFNYKLYISKKLHKIILTLQIKCYIISLYDYFYGVSRSVVINGGRHFCGFYRSAKGRQKSKK